MPSDDILRLICDYFKVDISVFDREKDDAEDMEELIAAPSSELEPVEEKKEAVNQTDDSIRNSIIVLAAGIVCLDLSPYSAPVCLFLIFYSIKKKLHPVMVLFSIYTLLYAVDDIFFAFGIDFLPRIWR